MTETPKKPPLDWNRVGRNPYFSIGIVFFAVAIVFFVNESMRTLGFAFLPLGIVFMSFALNGTGDEKPSDKVAPDDGAAPVHGNDPDSPPAPPGR